jgi:hypothetical protein
MASMFAFPSLRPEALVSHLALLHDTATIYVHSQLVVCAGRRFRLAGKGAIIYG